jgi:hypothetical protein
MLTGTLSRRAAGALSAATALTLCALPSAAEAPARVATPFTRQVSVNWVAWDKDGDGALSPSEIDSLVADARVAGEPAAAVAALKAAFRPKVGAVWGPGGPKPRPTLDRDYFAAYAQWRVEKARAAVKANGGDPDAPEPPESPDAPYPDFDRLFLYGRDRLQHGTTDAGLFGPGDPRRDRIRQGETGDCYLLAVLGAMADRDPAAVRRMVTRLPDRSYQVTFGSGRTVHLPALTDAQRLLLDSDGGGGSLWLAVLEDAYGRARNEERPEEARRMVASDLVVSGGTPQRVTSLLTGNATETVWFMLPPGTPAPTKPGEKRDPNARLRAGLAAAMKERRIAFATTGISEPPPGITTRHAYAVLGYDAAQGTVTFWNPYGRDFTPAGEPGIKNGYPTTAGVFAVPFADVPKIFLLVGWELNRRAEPDAPQPGYPPLPPPPPLPRSG